jgi:VWFA-related protein
MGRIGRIGVASHPYLPSNDSRTQIIALFAILLGALGVPRAAPAQGLPEPSSNPRLQETIEVSRIIIDAHVHDSDLNIITDLGPSDFQIRVDGKEAPIESVDWVAEVPTEEVVQDENNQEVSRRTVQPRGRLFICFVQTDFARNAPRVIGEMKVIRGFDQFVELLQPNDRVALLSFDSHLKLRLDFTDDRQQLLDAFPAVLMIDNPPPPPAVASPSLARLLDREEMKNAPDSERALTLVARALRQIEGPKNMILLGWGLGEPHWSRAVVTPQILRAAAELSAARVTVYAFNFGLGTQMSLGLKEVSADTGGFYAMGTPYQRLKAELQGHYEIEVRNPVPSVSGKVHRIEVRARNRGLTVTARNSFVDQ